MQDTETTGLDHAKDEIIELGMVKFDYTPDGRIVGLRDTFSAFNEPSTPISAEVTALTGITDEMVASHRFDDAAVTAFAEDASSSLRTTAGSTGNSPNATGRRAPHSRSHPDCRIGLDSSPEIETISELHRS
ncbi:exonuclease domain-containing protein [Bradyrhizobium sp. CCBAU 11361]|uniref:exonuclease domain-containing protein n=1 Tax=Bradyrhizobium sp. CCBAU 11361 TaxID=1630812 RepID=UPI002304A72B|nr:exonuclease domain-containing protein [Bradyrhizobium sp. CCBAU 11361]